MFVGLLLSAAAAWITLTNVQVLQAVFSNYLILVFAELGFVLVVSAAINRIGAVPALALFFIYAVLSGLTLGAIVFAYTVDPVTGTIASSGLQGVVSAFLGASAVFGAAALYGVVTKRDLTSMGGILFMGLIGLLVVMLLNGFIFRSSGLDFAIGIVGVLIFTGLTAFDVQRISRGGMPWVRDRDAASVVGALQLYLDFINLFLMMLRLFGGSRR
jgi:FtsH-binding integral membrane protein